MLNAIENISTLSVFIPIVCFIGFKSLNSTLKLLLLLFICSVLTEALCYYYAPNNLLAYNILQNIYTFVESTLLAAIFYIEFKSGIIKNFIKLFYAFLIVAALLMLWLNLFNKADVILITIECVVMVALSFSFFARIFDDLHIPRNADYPLFWFSSAILYYFATAFVLYVFRNKLALFSKEGFFVITVLNSITNITHYILFAIGICKAKKK